MKVTQAIVDTLNELVVLHYREVLTPMPWRYALSSYSDDHVAIIDAEDPSIIAHVSLAFAEVHPARTLQMARTLYGKGYEHGERYGLWAAQSNMRRAMGIEDAFLRLVEAQKAEGAN